RIGCDLKRGWNVGDIDFSGKAPGDLAADACADRPGSSAADDSALQGFVHRGHPRAAPEETECRVQDNRSVAEVPRGHRPRTAVAAASSSTRGQGRADGKLVDSMSGRFRS